MASQGIHTVRSGESLSKIAQAYGLSSHEPIWKFAARVRQKPISPDPNKISIGAKIHIPLTPLQYDNAISKLRELKTASDQDFAVIAADLNEEKARTDRFMGRLDLTADVIFFAKGAGKAALKYGPRLAKLAIGKNALQLLPSVFNTVNPNSDSAEGQVVSRSMSVAADNSGFMMSRRMPKGSRVGKSVGKQVADAGIDWLIGAAERAKWISGAVADGLNVVADVALKGLEAAAPSKIASFAIGQYYGKTPDEVHADAMASIERSRRVAQQSLEKSIARLTTEKQTVHR